MKDRHYLIALCSVFLVTLSFLAGCESERDRLMKDKYPSYPETIQRAIAKHYLMHGMNQEQVYLALGPTICKKTIEHKGRPVEVWLYPPGGRDPCQTAEFRVYFEKGAVSGWDTFTGATRYTVPPGFTEP